MHPSETLFEPSKGICDLKPVPSLAARQGIQSLRRGIRSRYNGIRRQRRSRCKGSRSRKRGRPRTSAEPISCLRSWKNRLLHFSATWKLRLRAARNAKQQRTRLRSRSPLSVPGKTFLSLVNLPHGVCRLRRLGRLFFPPPQHPIRYLRTRRTVLSPRNPHSSHRCPTSSAHVQPQAHRILGLLQQ